MAFGYVTGLFEDEWGYISIDELTDITWNGVPRIEIDRYFGEKFYSEIPRGG